MAEYNESQINSNETERIAAEQQRIENEAKRQTNETEREAKETTRQSNESTRISKEAERLAEEANRQEAENIRVNAEQGRQEAENTRAEFYEGFNDRLNEVDSQLAQIENDKLKKYGVHKITRKTKKILDDATVININNTGKDAEICGFRSDSSLSSYADRDSAIMYLDGVLPKCKVLEVVEFTTTSVEVIGDASSIEVGMIIDCMNQTEIDKFNQATKYSGFVVEVDGQVIKVSGWYQLGNSNSGQIPDKNRIIINPVTKLWGINANIFLEPDSFGWGGVVCELGLFNRKSVSTGSNNYKLNGIDLVNFGGYCDIGYQIRNANKEDTTITNIGYSASKVNTGYLCSNSNDKSFSSEGGSIGFNSEGDNVCFNANTSDNNIAFKTNNNRFTVYGNGSLRNFFARMGNYENNATIVPNNGFFHFVGSGTHTLPHPSNYAYCNLKIMAKQDCTIEGNMFTNTGNISTYTLNAWRTLELYCDGSKWYVVF